MRGRVRFLTGHVLSLIIASGLLGLQQPGAPRPRAGSSWRVMHPKRMR